MAKKKGSSKLRVQTRKLTFVMVAAIVTAIFVYPTYIVFIAMMLPTGVAYIVDRGDRELMWRCVGAVNICGTLPAILDLWYYDQNLDAARLVLSDVYKWLYAYLAAMVGWGLYSTIPRFVAYSIALRARYRMNSLHEIQRMLEEDWGEGIRSDALAILDIDEPDEENSSQHNAA